MRAERGFEPLCDVQSLQGGQGFGVGERHSAKLDEAQAEREQKSQRVQPAFMFEMSIGHAGNCNRLLLEGKRFYSRTI